jgi:primase-polymerase (primpol)-like protein
VSNLQLLVFIGGVITTILVIYSGVLAFKLKQKAKRRTQPVEFQPKSQSQLDAQQSIRVIAQALLQNDLTPTEAAMRIGFLAQQYSPIEDQAPSLQVFQSLAMETSHLPILDAWKALPASDKQQLDKERQSIENSHSEAIQVAANTLAKSF